jgi:apurinic endonuclease APN1
LLKEKSGIPSHKIEQNNPIVFYHEKRRFTTNANHQHISHTCHTLRRTLLASPLRSDCVNCSIAEYPIAVNLALPIPSGTNDVMVGPQTPRLLGIAEGVQWAVARGANACQLFLSGRYDWNYAKWPSEQPVKLEQVIANTGFPRNAIFVHSNLYQNLCSTKPYHRERSRESLEREMEICDHFGLRYLIVHPGSPGSKDLTDWAITQIADAINCALLRIPTVTILLENMAGQGNIVGSDLAQLAAIAALIADKKRIGYCIDTCHLHSSSIDLSKPNGADAFFTVVNDYLGIKNVKVIHLNDS